MFDIGWTEILILATVSLFVIGPKEIPKFLGYIGRMVSKLRGITKELQESVDDAIKNSELEDIRKEISFTDPELSKNLKDIMQPNNTKPNIKEEKKEDIETTKNEDNKTNSESVQKKVPKESLPKGLQHIRETDNKSLENKKNTEKKS